MDNGYFLFKAANLWPMKILLLIKNEAEATKNYLLDAIKRIKRPNMK